jgi:hypothetical protein
MIVGMAEDVLPAEDRIAHCTGELIAYVRSLFPMRFYSGEKWWTLYTSAALLRMADMADSVLAHMPARRELDAWAALRSMYELAVTIAWLLIEPVARKQLWEGEALIQQLKLHHDIATFGESLLTSAQVASAQASQGMPALFASSATPQSRSRSTSTRCSSPRMPSALRPTSTRRLPTGA